MAPWTVEPMSSPSDLDAILEIEQASFVNPWTREMYLAELNNRGVSYVYVIRDPSRQVIGFCSFWRVLDELHINNLAVCTRASRCGRVGTTLLGDGAARGRAAGRAPGDARGPPLERGGAARSTSGSGSRSRASGATITRIRSRTRSSSGPRI